jgi:LL-diaminopimelate aminotransferase
MLDAAQEVEEFIGMSRSVAEAARKRVAPARGLASLPTYVFSWLDERKAEVRARGVDLLDLGIGNPDRPTPPVVVEAIAAAFRDPAHHGYPPFRGTPRFRGAVARYMEERFGVRVDPEREVLCLSGAKEGLAQITLAFTEADTVSLVPDIYYPVHGRATGMAGGTVYPLPLRPETGYLPRLGDVPEEVLRRARLLLLNYPHNPTGATAPLELFEEAVALCARYGIVLVSDLAYAEITYDGYRAPSVLQVAGAKEVAVEMHSFSKSFNMAGSRVGFAVGSPELIETLFAVRMNMGYGTPSYIQEGTAVALERMAELTPSVVACYDERRHVAVEGFRALGWSMEPPRASMFVWLPVPVGFTSLEWTEHLMDTAGVVVTPGNAFGPGGEGFFRVSLAAEPALLREAFERLRRVGVGFEGEVQ